MNELTGSIESHVIEQLERDDKYNRILESVGDEKVKSQIDLTVKAFITELSKNFELLTKQISNDAEAREKLAELLRKR